MVIRLNRSVRSLIVVFCCVAIFIFSGCASLDFDLVDMGWQRGEALEAYRLLQDQRNVLYNHNDEVLYLLDAGLLAHYAGLYAESNAHLIEAERLIKEHFTISISSEFGTFVANDTVRPYRGEDYEDVYLNVFLALNHYHLNDMENMMVELRRADLKLRELQKKYEGPLKRSNADGVLEDTSYQSVKFSNSALVRYLSLLGYRTVGKRDDVRIDLEQLKRAFDSQSNVYTFPVPQSIDEEATFDKRPRLNIIAFSGAGPIKHEVTRRIAVDYHHYIKIALPEIQERFSPIRTVVAIIGNKQRIELSLLESLSSVARETFNLNRALIEAKTIVRALAKGTASIVADAASENSEGSASSWLSFASWFLQLYQEVTEQADLRISRYFPANAWVTGIPISEGKVSITLEFIGWNDQVLWTKDIGPVDIVSGGLNLVEAYCPF